MGHNLGMDHDFYDNKVDCKKESDSSSEPCSYCANWSSQKHKLLDVTSKANPGVGNNPGECCTGFMDYGDHPEYWSDCSVRDFEQHYNSENWASCMTTGSGGGGTVVPTGNNIINSHLL